MEFESGAQRQAFSRIQAWLAAGFGRQARQAAHGPVMQVSVGPILVHVIVTPWDDDDATIALRAYLPARGKLSAQDLMGLLRQNSQLRHGGYAVDDDGDIAFHYGISASSCTEEFFGKAVLMVAEGIFALAAGHAARAPRPLEPARDTLAAVDLTLAA